MLQTFIPFLLLASVFSLPQKRKLVSRRNKIIIHDAHRKSLHIDPTTKLVRFLQLDQELHSSIHLDQELHSSIHRTSKWTRKKKKPTVDLTDLSSSAGKKASQDTIKQLSNQVAQSRVNVGNVVAAHQTLENALEDAMKNGGTFVKPQTSVWHGHAYSYTPEHSQHLSLPYWNGFACAIGVVTGPAGHCHRSLGHTIGTCSAKPDLGILASVGFYSSKSCECSMCNGFSGKVFASPYCHTSGINTCHCMLVDNAIQSEDACVNLM